MGRTAAKFSVHIRGFMFSPLAFTKALVDMVTKLSQTEECQLR